MKRFCDHSDEYIIEINESWLNILDTKTKETIVSFHKDESIIDIENAIKYLRGQK